MTPVTELVGRRLPDLPRGEIHPDVQAGDYWRIIVEPYDNPSNLTGTSWYVAAPMSYGFALGRLTLHTVRENEDATISVLPGDGSSNSILITGHAGEQWHGFIHDGVWRHV